MNNNVYTLFASLCSDLGLTPSVSISEEMLQRARNALLVASESVDDNGIWDSLLTKEFQTLFALCFPKRDRRYSKPWRHSVFRDAYQAVCFTLKVETEYTQEQERIYLERFHKTEEDCRNWSITGVAHSELLRFARYAVRLAGNHWDFTAEGLAKSGVCRHGPGAVAERQLGSDKNVWSETSVPFHLWRWSGWSVFYANEEFEKGPYPDLTIRVYIPTGWLTPYTFSNEDISGALWVEPTELSSALTEADGLSLIWNRHSLTAVATIQDIARLHLNHMRKSASDYSIYVSAPPLSDRYAIRSIGGSEERCVVVDMTCVLPPRVVEQKHSIYDRVIARLSLVPKDWKGPRGVFISPKAAVWCQLGIWETIRRAIPQTWLSECYTPQSQVASQEAARSASITRSDATLDLSDASDRIPATLVKYLFHPLDWEALQATRPSAVELPGQSRLRKLYMFAPMGDGKTFPILTIVCAAISVAVLLIREGYVAARPPKEGVVRRLAKRIRIYGDDIIVPREAYADVCDALEVCNLRVNRQKSFVHGYFRESCGMDAYRGHDVTPLRLRFIPYSKPDCETAAKAVDLHNRVYMRRPDMYRTIKTLERYVQRSKWNTGYSHRTDLSPGLLACPASQVLQRNWERPRTRLSYNIALQRFEYGVFEVAGKDYLPSTEPWWDLNHWLIVNSREGASNLSDSAHSRKAVMGSPLTQKAYERLVRDAGGLVPEKQDIICRPAWVPLPTKVVA